MHFMNSNLVVALSSFSFNSSNKRCEKWAEMQFIYIIMSGEMAQWVKSLISKYKDLSSSSKHPHEMSNMVKLACNPRAGRDRKYWGTCWLG